MRHRGAVILVSVGLLAATAAPALAVGHHATTAGKTKAKKGTTISSGKVTATSSTGATESLGKALTSSKGRVMYLFTEDKGKTSRCTGACAQAWPKVTSKVKPVAAKGVRIKHLSRNSKHQVTYYGHPLYYFVGDRKPDKATGEDENDFFAVSLSGKAVKPPKKSTKPTGPGNPTGPSGPAAVRSGTAAANSVITDAANGHTLYELSSETDGTSPTFDCTGGCTSVWIPLLTKGAPTATGSAMASELGTVVRPDNTVQVTYNHHPLYTYTPDSAAGDANGEGVFDPPGYWYDIAPDGTPILEEIL